MLANTHSALGGSNSGNGGSGRGNGKPSTSYELRYQRVQAAGGERFYPKVPSRELIAFLAAKSLQPGKALVAGCGEGRNIGPLADTGWEVLGVDSAPTGLEVARRDHQGQEHVSFLEADLLEPLLLSSDSVDLVVAVGFPHMLVEEMDRFIFFQEVYRLLRKAGWFFLESNGRLESDEFERLQSGHIEMRTIQTLGGKRQIPLPRLPTVMLSGKGLRRELMSVGFLVERMGTSWFSHPDIPCEQVYAWAHK